MKATIGVIIGVLAGLALGELKEARECRDRKQKEKQREIEDRLYDIRADLELLKKKIKYEKCDGKCDTCDSV